MHHRIRRSGARGTVVSSFLKPFGKNSSTSRKTNSVKANYKNYAPKKITVTHPHTYADETLVRPVIVSTVSDALESIPPGLVPEYVLWAGREAARNRSASRAFRGSSLGNEHGRVATPVTASSATVRCSYDGEDMQTSPTEAGSTVFDRPLSLKHSVSSQRPQSFEIPKSRRVSIASSTSCGSRRKYIRGRKTFSRRFVLAWKRVTAYTRRLVHVGPDGRGKRTSRVPSGFEIVDNKTSWWRKNSSNRRKEELTVCRESAVGGH